MFEQIINSILDKAEDTLINVKPEEYGNVNKNFKRILSLWNSYLESKLNIKNALDIEDIPILMVLFKIARSNHKYKEDTVVDMIGYTAIYDYLCKHNIMIENYDKFKEDTKNE